jgi:hypothetical protein
MAFGCYVGVYVYMCICVLLLYTLRTMAPRYVGVGGCRWYVRSICVICGYYIGII